MKCALLRLWPIFKFQRVVFKQSSKKVHTVSIMTAPGEIESKRLKSNDGKIPVIGTHDGTFHCDEVLACFMLRQLPEYENSKIFRSRDDDKLRSQCDIIVDVGGVFDHEKKWYDHHQNSFQETFSTLRPDIGLDTKIRLSSAGLIYSYYGERVIARILEKNKGVTLSEANLRLCYIQVYKNFINEIDAIDNGVPMFPGEENKEPLYKICTHVSGRISKLNPSWDEESVDIDERFHQAMHLVGKEFTANVLNMGCSWIKAREHVRSALEKAKSVHESGEILILEKFCPWRAHLRDLEKEYELEKLPKLVLFGENSGWRVTGVPISPDSYLGRKFLPKPWRGLRDEELSAVAELPNLTFVHHTGFIGGAKTKEDALAMAIKSINWPDEDDLSVN